MRELGNQSVFFLYRPRSTRSKEARLILGCSGVLCLVLDGDAMKRGEIGDLMIEVRGLPKCIA